MTADHYLELARKLRLNLAGQTFPTAPGEADALEDKIIAAAFRESVEETEGRAKTKYDELFDVSAKLGRRADARVAELESEVKRMRETMDSIIIRCNEGDKRCDWLPIIERLAREAIAEPKAETNSRKAGG